MTTKPTPVDIRDAMRNFVEHQIAKHGQLSGYTEIDDYINSLTPYELFELICLGLEEIQQRGGIH